jgi:hypothetical protein
MRLLRGLPGALLWIVAAILGLVGVLLCLTVILLPLGIPLVKMAGRLFSLSVRLMLPRELAHPVNHLKKATDKRARTMRSNASGAADHVVKEGRTFGTAASNTIGGAAKKGRKVARKQAKNLV